MARQQKQKDSSSATTSSSSFKSVVLYFVIPYAIGYVFSHGYLSAFYDTIRSSGGALLTSWSSGSPRALTEQEVPQQQQQQAAPPSLAPQQCDENFLELLDLVDGETLESYHDVSFVVHRNGQAKACGVVNFGDTVVKQLKVNYEALGNGKCLTELNKYQVESLLTKTFHDVLRNNDCHSLETYGTKSKGIAGFCDNGKDHTPILLDHQDLVQVTVREGEEPSLPCRFHSREGLRITEFSQLTEMAFEPCQVNNKSQACNQSKTEITDQKQKSMEVHLYAVPAGRVFMFAPSYVGEMFYLPHVPGAAEDSIIYLEVLSINPRVFDVYNFFSREESTELVDRAIAESRDSHRIKRSTTGAGEKSVNSRRTSESGFDTHGKTAVKVKKRCFQALGFDEYWESHGDGLQILRYNVSKAYNSHLDWIEDKTGQLEHDYDSAGTGGNRFATILLYMSDLGPDDGGETVFPKGWPADVPENERLSQDDVIAQYRASEQGSILKHGSWEEKLVAHCRSNLSIRPHSSRAVLFYSQHPNGKVDNFSIHGACPVLDKQKYAANLWVWNTPRSGYAGAPIKEKFRDANEAGGASSPSSKYVEINAKFRNSGKDPKTGNAKLYYEDQFWGNLGPNDPPLGANTYEGHTWNIRVGDEVIKQIVISEKEGKSQSFSI